MQSKPDHCSCYHGPEEHGPLGCQACLDKGVQTPCFWSKPSRIERRDLSPIGREIRRLVREHLEAVSVPKRVAAPRYAADVAGIVARALRRGIALGRVEIALEIRVALGEVITNAGVSQ